MPRAWSVIQLKLVVARDDDSGGIARSGGRTQSRPANPWYSCAITASATDRRSRHRARARSAQRRRRIPPTQRSEARARRRNGFCPLHSAGCLRLLRESGVALSGANVVVLGRSMIVGKPMALLLMRKGIDATVTVIHSRTRKIPEICHRADVIIAAIGRPHFVRTEFVSEGATVIDVGINRLDDAKERARI